jgi:hypothetical protein
VAVKVKASATEAVLENDLVSVTIGAMGGAVLSLVNKSTKIDCASGSPTVPMTGLCNSRIWEKKRFSELLEADFALKVTRETNDLIEVECRCNGVEGAQAGGCTYIKRYTLERNSARLRFHYRIEAGDQWAEFTPWIHNSIALPRDKVDLESTRITAQLSKGLWSNPAFFAKQTSHLLSNMNETWLAATTESRATGVTIVVRPESSLQRFFSWTGSAEQMTMEAIFTKRTFAPNASFSTNMTFIPHRGLKSCHLATEDYAGSFQMEGGKPVLALFPAATFGKAKVTVTRGSKSVGSGEMALKAGSPVALPVALGKSLQTLQVTLVIDGRVCTHTIRASAQLDKSEATSSANLDSRVADKANTATVNTVKKRLYVSDEMALVSLFGMRHTFKKPPLADFVIDLPQGVEATFTAEAARAVPKLKSKRKLTINGQPYTRYTMSKRVRNYGRWAMLFVKTSWKAGKTGKAYFHAKWEGGKQKKVEIDIEAISIGVAPQPKRLITNLGWMSIDVHSLWPDFYAAMRQVGMNTLCGTKYDLYKPAKLKATAKKAKAEGFWFAQNYSPFLGKRHIRQVMDANALAVDRYGNPSKLGFMSPSHRGKAFKAEVDVSSDCAKAGISMLWHDPEIWRGADFCYSAQSIRRFRAYLKQNHPKVAYRNPHVFEKAPEKFPKLHQAWLDFRVSLGTELFAAIRKRFDEKVVEYGADSGPEVIVGSYGMTPGTTYHQFLRFDEQYKADAINACMPSLYVAGDALEVARRVRKCRQAIGKGDLIPWLTAGYGAESAECRPIDVKHMILETFLNGARGFTSYTWYGFDGIALKYMTEALRMLVPVEDIIMDGDLLENIGSSNAQAKVCGMKSGKETLLLVRDYFSDKKIITTLTLPRKTTGDVIDMESGRKLGALTNGKQFKVTLDKKRVRLLYIGPRNPLK